MTTNKTNSQRDDYAVDNVVAGRSTCVDCGAVRASRHMQMIRMYKRRIARYEQSIDYLSLFSGNRNRILYWIQRIENAEAKIREIQAVSP